MNYKNECMFIIKQLHDSIEKHVNSGLRDYNITMAQIGALMFLNHTRNGECSLKEFEQILHVAQSTTVGITKRLEKKRLITSYIDDTDRRNKKIKITDQGIKLCIVVDNEIDLETDKLFSSLSEEEMKLLLSLMKKICDNMKQS